MHVGSNINAESRTVVIFTVTNISKVNKNSDSGRPFTINYKAVYSTGKIALLVDTYPDLPGCEN